MIPSRLGALPREVFGSPAGRQDLLASDDRTIRAPLSVNHRIAFVQLHGGVGASATAAAVASLLARRRPGAVLAVNASGGSRSLLWYAGLGPTAGTERSDARDRAARRSDATTGLARTAGGLHALDVHAERDDAAVPESVWARQSTPIARFFDVTCTDWGRRGVRTELPAIAAGAQVVCLVVRAERPAVERAIAVAEPLAAQVRACRVVVAAVDVGDSARALPGALLGGAPGAVVRLPYEPARRGGEPAGSRQWSARTRAATIRLAGELMRQDASAEAHRA